MFNTKTALAAAALAVITAAGTFSASAAPLDRHDARVEHRLDRRDMRVEHRMDRRDMRIEHRMDRRDARFEHRMIGRHYVDRARVHSILWSNHYRMIGEPYFLGGRYVVRTYDRFGHVVLVRIDPWTGAFMGVVRL